MDGDDVLGLAALVIRGKEVGRPLAAVGDDEAYGRTLRGVLDHRQHAAGQRRVLVVHASQPVHGPAGALEDALGRTRWSATATSGVGFGGIPMAQMRPVASAECTSAGLQKAPSARRAKAVAGSRLW